MFPDFIFITDCHWNLRTDELSTVNLCFRYPNSQKTKLFHLKTLPYSTRTGWDQVTVSAPFVPFDQGYPTVNFRWKISLLSLPLSLGWGHLVPKTISSGGTGWRIIPPSLPGDLQLCYELELWNPLVGASLGKQKEKSSYILSPLGQRLFYFTFAL